MLRQPLRMNLKEIKELVDLMTEKGITEFELERSGVKVRIKRGANAAAQVSFQGTGAPSPHPSGPPPAQFGSPAVGPMLAPPLPAAPVPAEPPQAPELRAEDLHVIKAPIVGTFYDAPSPGTPPFVRVGDRVEAGQVLCIIEAMKLMNEIESDAAGDIVKLYVENAQPVEYGESLFAIRPAKGKR